MQRNGSCHFKETFIASRKHQASLHLNPAFREFQFRARIQTPSQEKQEHCFCLAQVLREPT